MFLVFLKYLWRCHVFLEVLFLCYRYIFVSSEKKKLFCSVEDKIPMIVDRLLIFSSLYSLLCETISSCCYSIDLEEKIVLFSVV